MDRPMVLLVRVEAISRISGIASELHRSIVNIILTHETIPRGDENVKVKKNLPQATRDI